MQQELLKDHSLIELLCSGFSFLVLGLGLSWDELEFHHLNLDAEGHTFKQSSGKASRLILLTFQF